MFYDLKPAEREAYKISLKRRLRDDALVNRPKSWLEFFSHKDTYVRREAYLAAAKLYRDVVDLRSNIIRILDELSNSPDPLVRQTVINSYGEIGRYEPQLIFPHMLSGLEDTSSRVKNAVTGSLKKIGKDQPAQLIDFVSNNIKSKAPGITSRLLHGLELRGRSHPEDILTLLGQYYDDPRSRVREMVAHILVQISYRKASLEKVLASIANWPNNCSRANVLEAIMDKHAKGEEFAHYTADQALNVVKKYFPDFSYTISDMTIRHLLASNAGKKDETPNVELARTIANSKNVHHVRELVQILKSGKKPEKHDAIKTLYELGELEPRLISRYADVFLDELNSHDNRMVWGAMTALRTISKIKHAEIWDQRKRIIDKLRDGSVITRDEAVKVLAGIASKREEYGEQIVPVLLEVLANDRPKDVAKNAENTLPAVSERFRDDFVEVLRGRKSSLTKSAQQRVEKLFRSIQ